MNTVTVIPSRKTFSRFAKKSKAVAEAVLLYLNNTNSALEIYCVTDEEMKVLNKVFRGKNTPTNILSFESEDFLRGDIKKKQRYLGEIYLAPQFIEKKNESLPLLVIHGILHCLGYTHERRNDRIEMETREDAFLNYAKHHYRY